MKNYSKSSRRALRRVKKSLERAWLMSPSAATRDAINDALTDAWTVHATKKANLFR